MVGSLKNFASVGQREHVVLELVRGKILNEADKACLVIY